MKARLYAIVFAALSMAGFSPAVLADNDSNNVSWKRVIGIIQAGNMVGNIQGGGQPWSTLGGEARVNLGSGHVEFEVRGLVLAGGNTIGTVPSTIKEVKGTIVCGPGTPTQVVVDTPFVPLSAQGDAEFDGNVGHLPAGCAPNNLAFLVRIDAGRWIANGAVRSSP